MTEAEQLFEQVYRTYGPSLYRFCLIHSVTIDFYIYLQLYFLCKKYFPCAAEYKGVGS